MCVGISLSICAFNITFDVGDAVEKKKKKEKGFGHLANMVRSCHFAMGLSGLK